MVDKKIVGKDEEVDRALLWKVAREDKNGKIVDEEVAELTGTIEKEEGLITVSGYQDVLAMALGTPEHAGRVRGVGGFVKPSVFFNVPRKKRECVSKGMLQQRKALLEETKKMMEDQHKKHEAAQQLLQKQIEMLKVAISSQPYNASTIIPNISPMSEKASTNIPSKFENVAEAKDVSEDACDDVVEQTEVKANKGKDCKLAFGSKDNIVASGTIVDINVPGQLIHNVPLGEGIIRVCVNYAINGASPLPIPVKGVLNTVEDAVGSQVAWPEDLIVFLDDMVKKTTTKEKLAKSLFQSIPETVPKSCKILYGFAQKLMSEGQTLSSYIHEDIFGVEKMICILKEDVISLVQMNKIGQAVITAYISW